MHKLEERIRTNCGQSAFGFDKLAYRDETDSGIRLGGTSARTLVGAHHGVCHSRHPGLCPLVRYSLFVPGSSGLAEGARAAAVGQAEERANRLAPD